MIVDRLFDIDNLVVDFLHARQVSTQASFDFLLYVHLVFSYILECGHHT